MIIINFTEEMKQIIIDTYPKYGIKETIKKLGLDNNSKYDVQHMAQKLNLKRIGKYFTQKEIRYLKENYSTKTINDISNYLNKSKDAIIHKACSLGLSNNIFFYSEKEVQFLKDNYGILSNQEIATKIGKTISSVESKISKLGLSSEKAWSKEEIEILKHTYPYYTNKKISNDFLCNRNATSIATMAHKYDLVKSQDKSVKWYNKADMIIQLKKVADNIGRTPYEYELISFGLPSEKTYCRYWESYRNACVEAKIKPNCQMFGRSNHYVSINGVKCASKSEKIVSDYLEMHNISYEKSHYTKIISTI